jgi:hypothetical protein
MIVRCSCGKVEMQTTGAPIVCVACHCADCYAGSRRLEALSQADSIVDSSGGTQYVLFRKDRARFSKGAELVKSFKLQDDSSTQRTYAGCCNSFLTLDLPQPMHWVPICRSRFQDQVPPLEMRVNFKPNQEFPSKPHDVPSFSSFSLKFMMKLIGSKIAMLLGR